MTVPPGCRVRPSRGLRIHRSRTPYGLSAVRGLVTTPVPRALVDTWGDAHRAKAVRAYLEEWGHRVVLHYLPKYAPDTNPIERVWWRLHEAVTRNHRCRSMQELLDLTFAWLGSRNPFRVEGSVYPRARAA